MRTSTAPDPEEEDPWDSKGRARRVREADYWDCVQYLVGAGLVAAVAVWAFSVSEPESGGALLAVAALCVFGAWRTWPRR